jgi:rubrerythrin
MTELRDFYNAGFGWICRHCERELKPAGIPQQKHSRAFREGEEESKDPALSNLAIAKWTDKTQQILICPRCGITEAIEKS